MSWRQHILISRAQGLSQQCQSMSISRASVPDQLLLLTDALSFYLQWYFHLVIYQVLLQWVEAIFFLFKVILHHFSASSISHFNPQLLSSSWGRISLFPSHKYVLYMKVSQYIGWYDYTEIFRIVFLSLYSSANIYNHLIGFLYTFLLWAVPWGQTFIFLATKGLG